MYVGYDIHWDTGFTLAPVPVPQATASRIEMKLAVKVSHYLFSPVKVVHLEYLV